MTNWMISVLAQGAALTMTTQISLTEKIGFECSAAGLSVLAQLERTTSDSGETFELALDGEKFKADIVYMIESKPRFWSGGYNDSGKIFSILAVSEKVEIVVPGRSVGLELDKTRTQDFASSCINLLGTVK